MAIVDGIEVDSKFDLDPQIYRSAEQRCAMVEDVDCPQVVLRIIAMHDEDQIVLQIYSEEMQKFRKFTTNVLIITKQIVYY